MKDILSIAVILLLQTAVGAWLLMILVGVIHSALEIGTFSYLTSFVVIFILQVIALFWSLGND